MESIYLDVTPRGVNPTVYTSQGDANRSIGVYLIENGLPYELSGSETLTLNIKTSEGEYLEQELTNAGGNFIEISLESELSVKAGANYCKIIIETDDIKIGSSAFWVLVEKQP